MPVFPEEHEKRRKGGGADLGYSSQDVGKYRRKIDQDEVSIKVFHSTNEADVSR